MFARLKNFKTTLVSFRRKRLRVIKSTSHFSTITSVGNDTPLHSAIRHHESTDNIYKLVKTLGDKKAAKHKYFINNIRGHLFML